MNVSCSMVGRPYSEVSSTALRQHGGCQNRLRSKEQPPLIRKVMSGAVNNASQLKNPLNLNPIIGFIGIYPKRKGPSQLTRGNDPSFLRLNEHSPGSTLFLHPNLPSDPTLFPMVLYYQLTIARPS